MNESTERAIKLPEGLILALSAPAAYLLAFSYELGVCTVFRIHYDLIEITLTRMLVIAITFLFTILLSAFFVRVVIAALLALERPLPEPLVSPVAQTVIVFTMFLLCVSIFGSLWSEWFSWWAIWAVLSLSGEYLAPLIWYRNKPSYLEKLSTHQKGRPLGQIADFFVNPVAKRAYSWFWYSVWSLVLFFIMGRASALRTTEFQVLSTSPERVVLRVYGEKLLAKPLNRETKVVKNELVIVVAGQDPKLEIRLERVGPLQISD